ncbi:hypothetical protein [Lysinibacillus sphaericus]|uniref:hypothetical protein n=1 Tax=Lysinibacillus sphaericus TaxID=1421 RepID=UPI003F79E84B
MFKVYNMNQLILPLDLEVKLQENDIAFSNHHLVESIPNEAFAPFIHHTGCPLREFCTKAQEGTNRKLRTKSASH